LRQSFGSGSTNLIVVKAPHCGHVAMLAVGDGIVVEVNTFMWFPNIHVTHATELALPE